MAIQTQESFSGFVASEPQFSRTEHGDARLFMKVGKEHYRPEEDGSFTQLETTFHNMVAFKAAAEQGYQRLSKGDKIVAEGYVREYEYEREGQKVEGEEFVARRLGHDMARTRYDVDRTPRRDAVEQEAPARAVTAFDVPQRTQAAPSASGIGL
ncbi:Single-stranded DNA-binding protein [Brevibacterium aurantiacum]|uniref:Single-stranded DNA-binding protein n=1 Tax=Brevibacterium aurantiacum TaxID=273384 RepID=A0A2H1IR64_BREAU|nr:single-stranded DNA-binding protein [Brevibacterium aurantiacum]SMX77631.1 Single-stranded DNA-binding protein [Brevibacterium aurantiacum]